MYARVDKSKANKSRAAANSVAQNCKSTKQMVGFVDRRLEAGAQKNYQRKIMKSIAQPIQLKYSLKEKMNEVQSSIISIMSKAAYVSRITSKGEYEEIVNVNGIIPSNSKKGGFDEAKKWVTMGKDPQLEHTGSGQNFVTRFHLKGKLLDWAKNSEYPINDETEGEELGKTDKARNKYQILTVKSNGSEIGNLGVGAQIIPDFNGNMISKIEPVNAGKKK